MLQKREAKEMRASIKAAITTAIVGIIGFLGESVFILINFILKKV